MKGKVSIILMVGFMVSLCSFPNWAQSEEEKTQLYFVREAAINPSRVMEYTALVKELVALETEHKFPYRINAFSTDNLVFYHSIPLKNAADLDNMAKAMGELRSKIGTELGQKIQKLAVGTTEYHKDGLILLRPDLSYTPENPRLKPEEVNFYHWTFYYFHPGMEREVEAISKEILALYKSKNISEGYEVYEGIMGLEAPMYIVISKAKDAADYYSRVIEINKLLGEEGEALDVKALPLLRKFESKQGRFLPELSYIPKEK